MVNINSLERDGLRQAELCPRHTMKMKTKNNLIPDRSQPGITMTAPTVRHRDVGDKYATGVPKIKKIRGRENIAVGTWNVRTLRPAGKLEQLTHAMSRYQPVRYLGKSAAGKSHGSQKMFSTSVMIGEI